MLVVIVPTAMWFANAPAARGRWRPRALDAETADRDTWGTNLHGEGPPLFVRAAAIGAWVLGCMFLPGLLAGLLGLIVYGLGLISVPGLVVAARLFLLGGPLLRAEPAAAEKARSVARLARVLNYVVLTLCAGFAYCAFPTSLMNPRTDVGWGLIPALAVACYAALSLGHASLLVRSADAIDAQQRIDPAVTALRIDAADVATAEEMSATADAAARRARAEP